MSKRSVKVRKMYINGDGAISEETAAELWKTRGREFHYLSIQYLKEDKCAILQQATAQRKLLRRLQVEVRGNCYERALAPYLVTCGSTLEVLSLAFQNSLPLLLGATKFPSLHTLDLGFTRWNGGVTTAEFENDFLHRCPNLIRFSGSDSTGRSAFLRALAKHCPLLQVLSLHCKGIDTAELVVALRACTQLHTVMLKSSEGTKPEDGAAIAEHCHNLHSLLLDEPTADLIDTIVPRLPQIEHLVLRTGSSEVILPIHVLTGRCDQLKSLTLGSLNEIPESALIDLLSTLPLLEEIYLHTVVGPCISNAVLSALGKACSRLRRASFICLKAGDVRVEGFRALAQG
jgi:hypothetical protein